VEQIDIIKSAKRARVVSLMEMTCQSNGIPVQKNQNRWVKLLFDEAPQLLWSVKLVNGNVILSDPEGKHEPISITDLHAKMDEIQLMTPASDLDDVALTGDAQRGSLYRYHIKIMQLINSVVLGRNGYALSSIETLAQDKGLDLDSLVTFISMSTVPFSFRTRCCRLIRAMYVDRDPFHHLSAMIHTHVWTGLNQSFSNGVQGCLPGQGDTTAKVRELKAVLLSLLQQGNSIETPGSASADASTDLSDRGITRAASIRSRTVRGVSVSLQRERLFFDEFLAEIIETLGALLKFGFFHSYNDEKGQQTLEICEMQGVVKVLILVLDTRRENLQKQTSSSSSSSSAAHKEAPNNKKRGNLENQDKGYFRSYIPDEITIVDKRNIEVLKLCNSFMDYCLSDATSKVVAAWENLLSDVLECPDQRTALSKFGDSSEGPDVTIQIAESDSRESATSTANKPKWWPALGSRSLRGTGGGNSVAANSGAEGRGLLGLQMTQNNEACSLAVFARDKTLWVRAPPWTPAAIEKIVQTVSTSSIIPELSVELICGEKSMANAELPRVVKILLDLVQRRDIELKTSATAFLIRIYRQQTAIWRAIQHIDFICDKAIAVKNRTLQDLIYEFRMQRRHLINPAAELCASDEGGQQARSLSDLAFQTCASIFAQWTSMLVDSRTPQEVLMTQGLMAHLHIHREACSLLALSVQVEGGVAGAVRDKRMIGLVNVVYEFLASLCTENTKVQNELVVLLACSLSGDGSVAEGGGAGQADLIRTHVQLENVCPEQLMRALLSQNFKVSSALGRNWGRFILATLNTSHLKSHKGAALLQVLSSMVICNKRPIKAQQDLVRTLIQGNPQQQALLVPEDSRWKSEWYLGGLKPSQQCALETQAAFLVLLSDLCKGKNPASNVFAERLVPLHWLVHTAIRIAMLPISGELDDAAKDTVVLAARLQHALLTFMRNVYLGWGIQDLCPEFATSGNGIWSLDVDAALQLVDGRAGMALFPALGQQLSVFASSFASWPSQQVKSYCHCLTHAILPLLRDYYNLPHFLLPERALARNISVAEEIWDVLNVLTKRGGALMAHLPRPHQMLLRSNAFALMNHMVHNGGVSREIVSEFDLQHVSRQVDGASRVSECLRAGFAIFSGAVAKCLREKECTHTLPMLFSADDDAVIYDDFAVPGVDADPPVNPKIATLLIDCMPVLASDSADDETIIDLLSLVRGAMYLAQPHKVYRSDDISVSLARSLSMSDGEHQDLARKWQLFTGLSSVLHTQDGDRAMLLWVQNKFDAIGCTQVALRLCSHDSVGVQRQALSLLIALLEGANEGVQNAITVFFKTHKRTSFFRVAHETLVATKDSLKDLKRMLKPKSKAHAKTLSRSVSEHESSLKLFSFDANGNKSDTSVIGRESQVMLLLRMLQLMCAGQYGPLQDLMQKQSSLAISFNLVRACTTLLGAVQPLANNIAGEKDPSSFLVLQTQLLATLCDMVQGPNLENQKEILASSALFDVNRIFSSIKYIQYDMLGVRTSVDAALTLDNSTHHSHSVLGRDSTQEQQMRNSREFVASAHTDPTRKSTSMQYIVHLNTLIELLKMEALKLCLAFFDSVLDPEIPTRMLGFFDVSNLVSQIVTNGELLGLTSDKKSSTKSQRRALKEDHDRLVGLFSEGYEQRLRTEMLRHYHLLRYLKYYEQGDQVSAQLKRIKDVLPVLYTYLKCHTTCAEVSRALSLDASGHQMIVGKDDGNDIKHVERVFFPVSEHMVSLVESKGFKVQWHKILWDLPHTKQNEKHKQLISKMRQTLAMAQWLQTVATNRLGHFLMRKHEAFRIAQLRICILITVLLLLYYGLPIDPNDGGILVDGTFQMGLYARSRPPAGPDSQKSDCYRAKGLES